MNKAQLVEHMAKLTKLPKSTCKDCLEAFIKTITSALGQGKSVVMTGFGTFMVSKRKKRKGVNPATGQEMMIPPKKVAKFKAGKALKITVAK